MQVFLKNIAIVDIDGTVADINHRLHYIRRQKPDWDSFFAACVDDRPIEQIVRLVRALHEAGLEIAFLTGRSDIVRDETEQWLRDNVFYGAKNPDFQLIMRKAGDHRPDDLVKYELYMENIHRVYNVEFVLEDRSRVVKMWRDAGLTCLQVAEGDF